MSVDIAQAKDPVSPASPAFSGAASTPPPADGTYDPVVTPDERTEADLEAEKKRQRRENEAAQARDKKRRRDKQKEDARGKSPPPDAGEDFTQKAGFVQTISLPSGVKARAKDNSYRLSPFNPQRFGDKNYMNKHVFPRLDALIMSAVKDKHWTEMRAWSPSGRSIDAQLTHLLAIRLTTLQNPASEARLRKAGFGDEDIDRLRQFKIMHDETHIRPGDSWLTRYFKGARAKQKEEPDNLKPLSTKEITAGITAAQEKEGQTPAIKAKPAAAAPPG